ncbi:NAD(P)-dependent methylenetetrahydromethanopterin dehydrogenase [Oharaeibacter diazotrophicus]|uniref:Methylenetetrahydromethanopterin dehydrogenase (NADP) n=1 Tax=Oharaeibacter diazotrophicus TaxID=1920512 RepID=A0A4R6RLI6_9HYPH|nr:NAD(P)-dependent methylenetetrahydromethanopterin dehydrogenase [Oharaeibacter diazotrophicus]TDP86596.1 methylenetetrahydromethanopterin dehydrogenase (NADP) [Oharaeibacter diazotrophicus]BBE71462.1 methylenetetrahydromethanopterin dehydrogenase [Pleomorphomonas sp. SM30]GLS78222.1 methylenetetrahydromethanopterin dehydrogenase [Oharaeibacter diazotrophicus]
MSKTILHMITPLKHMSPFDVNMAADAGYDVIATYQSVTPDEVRGLVQDAIFSRSPSDAVKTGFFIAGKNAIVSLDMMKTTVESFVPPFEINVFADPAGSFTTAAGMVASAEKLLADRFGTDLKGKRVVIYGGTGVVAFSAAVIAALEGASVVITGYDGIKRVAGIAADMKERFGVDVEAADGSSSEKNLEAAAGAEIIFSAGPAGVQILDEQQIRQVKSLLVAADVNAVPPAGIAGIDVMANGEPIPGTDKALALGALAIGNVKYQAQHLLFKRMIATETPVALDFRHAFEEARRFIRGA